MKKASKRRKIIATPPMLVISHVIPSIEIELRAAITAFDLGYADAHHHATLADRLSIHRIARLYKTGSPANSLPVAAASLSLSQILERANAGGGWTADTAELASLKAFANADADFWKLQPGSLMQRAKEQLDYLRRKEAAGRLERKAA